MIDTRKTILVVDDQAINRQLLMKILDSHYHCIEAENGQEGLKQLKQHQGHIAAVLTDIRMPVMDGYAFVRAIRQDSAKIPDMPVLVITEVDLDQAEEKALACGANDVLSKPYKPGIILKRLDNLIALRENTILLNTVKRDALTGVFAKEYFLKLVDERPRDRAVDYAMIYMDIEHFHFVNELFGEDIGDQVLIHVAHILQENLGPDCLIGRVQGDHFAVLAEYHGREELEKRLTSAIGKTAVLPITYNLVLRFGIYRIGQEGRSATAFCDRAKQAIKTIRDQYGLHIAYFDRSRHQLILQEQEMTDSMQQGLREKQFEVYYQPKYNLQTHQIIGAEALIRWNHPTMGFLSPGLFIPVFEKNGFITEMDKYTWDTVCRQLSQRIDAGLPIVPISVNVSLEDFMREDLAAYFPALIARYGLPASLLHLEVTESYFTNTPYDILHTVSALRDAGFVIEMDDFGSGYSSLTMLGEIPMDVLKLDMKFLKSKSPENARDSIIYFVIRLGHWLGLKVLAEGIETKEEEEMLLRYGCHLGQGFYFDRPMPERRFSAELRRRGIAGQKPAAPRGVETEGPAGQCLSPLPSIADLSEFINHSPHAFVIIEHRETDDALVIQYASPSLFTITGLDTAALNEVIARKDRTFIPENSCSDLWQAIRTAQEGGDPVDVPFVINHPTRGTIALQSYVWVTQSRKIHVIIHLSDRFHDALTKDLFSEDGSLS